MCHRSGGTATGSRGQGVSGAAFPDFDLDILAVEGLEKLNVGTFGEAGMNLKGRTDFTGQFAGNLIQGDNTVGVADVSNVNPVVRSIDLKDFSSVGLGFPGVAPKAHTAHINRYGCCVCTDLAGYNTAKGINGEGIAADASGIVEVTGKNA